MKTRTVVLNENVDAKNSWPARGILSCHNSDDADEEKFAYCCLGCLGLTYSISSGLMEEYGLLSELFDAKGTVVDGGNYWDLLDVFMSEKTFEKIADRLTFDLETASRTFEDVAALINDDIAMRIEHGEASREDVDAAVESLRVLFTWAGKQLGERWVIRHLKDDRIFGGNNEN